MYVILARKYRPQNFEEVIGQEHITRTLARAITSGRIASAYLFAGQRGVGKTSLARILAKALNCEKGPTPNPCNQCDSCKEITAGNNIDVLEIDGASNRGIDQIRDLRENVKFIPSKSRFKIYIIDEVHMLTTEAFNALLKTLEEPPAHIKFIFATTQPERIIPTILSRCQRFDFKPIKTAEILVRLKNISERENVKAEEEALKKVALFSSGSLRDAISTLDQLISFSEEDKIDLAEVNDLLGLTEEEVYFKIVETIINNNPVSLFAITHKLISQGKDLGCFFTGLLGYFRNILLVKENIPSSLLDINAQSRESLKEQSGNFSSEELFQIIERIFLFRGEVAKEESASIASEVFLFSLLKDFSKKTPPVEEKTTKPTTSYVISDEEIKEVWPLVLEEVKENKKALEACLREGRIKKVEDESVTVEFGRKYGFHKEMVGKNRKIIEEILGKKFSKKFTVKTAFGKQEEEIEPSKPAGSKRELTLEEEKKIKNILDLFGGKIASRKGE